MKNLYEIQYTYCKDGNKVENQILRKTAYVIADTDTNAVKAIEQLPDIHIEKIGTIAYEQPSGNLPAFLFAN